MSASQLKFNTFRPSTDIHSSIFFICIPSTIPCQNIIKPLCDDSQEMKLLPRIYGVCGLNIFPFELVTSLHFK